MDTDTDSPIGYSVREAAKLIKLGKDTTYKLIKNGTLRTTLIGGRTVVLPSAIDGYLKGAAMV